MAKCIKCGTPVPDPGEGRLYMLNEECIRLRQENKDLKVEVHEFAQIVIRLKEVIFELGQGDSGFGDTNM
jgi:hypothetical protein